MKIPDDWKTTQWEGVRLRRLGEDDPGDARVFRHRHSPSRKLTRRRALPLYLRVRNHSPTGFEWAYNGSGPAQLALAILVDHLGFEDRALQVYQEFKADVVAKLPREGWVLTVEQVAQWIEKRAPLLNPMLKGGAS